MTVNEGIEDEHWQDKLDALNAQVMKAKSACASVASAEKEWSSTGQNV